MYNRIARTTQFSIGTAALVAGGFAMGCTTNEIGRIEADTYGDLSNGDVPRIPFDQRFQEGCGGGGTTAIGDELILRQPYIQKVTSSSATVMWTSVGDVVPMVAIWSRDGDLVTTANATADITAPLPRGRQFFADIDGLQPNQMYCYEIIAGDTAWVDATGFVTAPPLGDNNTPIRFVALGDLGQRTIDQFAVRDQLTGVEADFALITGDIAYDTGRLVDFENNVFDVYASLMRHMPFFPASGNHDYGERDAIAFRQVFGLFENGGDIGRERWYSFNWGNVHVAVLDTERFFAEQEAWLAEDLEHNDAEWTIVVAHRPPYSSGWHGSDYAVRDSFGPIFERYNVDLVLLGHEHDYERTHALEGVTYIVAGAGGRGTRSVGKSSFTAMSAQVSHFVWGEVKGSEMSLYTIDGVGQLFDSVVLRHE